MNKIFKIIISMLLIAFISFNSFAAVVSDNDGSAFVTKSEFDALKKGFNQQISNYNDSIDGKIDGAIAQYLSGTKISTLFVTKANVEEISYPLMIADRFDILGNLQYKNGTTTIYPAHQSEPVMDFGYFNYYVLRRNPNLKFSRQEIPHTNRLKYFLNGNWNAAKNKFIVDGTVSDINVSNSLCVLCDNLKVGGSFFCMVCLDFKTITLDSAGSTINDTTKNYSRLYITDKNTTTKYHTFYNDYDNVKPISALTFNITAGVTNKDDGFDYTKTDCVHTDKNLDYWPNKNNTYWAALVDNSGSQLFTTSYTKNYDKNKIKLIYNNTLSTSASGYQKYIAGISYGNDNEIYFSNVNRNRKAFNCTGEPKYYWNNRTNKGATDATFGITGLITEGLNIESPYSGSTHTADQKSAAPIDQLYYNFKTAQGTTKEHKMVDGIPIYSVPNEYNDEKVAGVTVEFNLESEKDTTKTNKKYAIFSKTPIDTYNYSDDVSAKNYLVIKSANGSVVNAKKVEIQEGTNSISLPPVSRGETLYMKLLWNDATEQYVTITNAPEIQLVLND